jgi:hypothetical protein
MVDGAGANNMFFGEQRGGQRPVANVAMEAVKEFQVVAEGAAPEFGGYTGAFINVVTKSGTNNIHGSLYHLQELSALTQDLADGTAQKDFTREQLGGSIGGPIKKNKLFYFGTFEGAFNRFKKDNRLIHCCTRLDSNGIAHFSSTGAPVDLNSIFSSQFGSNEAGPLQHTNDLQAFLAKMDWIPSTHHTATFRDYFARSIQKNGTFDVPTFGRTANGEELDYSNAFISSWTWAISPTYLNEFRFQFARENRPRSQVLPPDLPDTSIGPCTLSGQELSPATIGCQGINFRFGRPFFHPSFVIDKQFQINDNFSIVHGQHAFKFGFNTLNILFQNFFQGFARGRFTFDTVEGFLNYINPALGPGFVECADGSSGTAATGTARCLTTPSPTNPIVGPLTLYLQFTPVPPFTAQQAATNNFNQFESGIFIQDKWQARPGLTVTYGLRWENYNQRGPAIPPSQTRISQFLSNPAFPSNGLVPGYHKAVQPRLGIAWDPWNNGKMVIRANGGVFFGDLPGLAVANGTANNGSIAGTVFFASFFNGFGLTPPAYPNCATGTFTPPACPPSAFPLFDPQVVLFAKDFVYPRTYEGSIWVERELVRNWKVSAGFNYALGTHENRNILFNHPFATTLGPDGRQLYNGFAGPFSGPGGNGSGIATFSNVIRSDGRSLYRGFTVKVDRQFSHGVLLTGYYTYSRTIDDGTTERDQFTFQFSDPVNFAPERGPSPQDQRHTFGLFSVWNLPLYLTWSNNITAHSARPTSLLCNFDANNDSVADSDRVFTDGQGHYSCGPGSTGRSVLVNGQVVPLQNSLTNGHDTGRNRFRFPDVGFIWNTRIQRDWIFRDRYKLVPSVEIFNLTDNNNLLFPACSELQNCFQGTILQIPGDSRRAQLGLRLEW